MKANLYIPVSCVDMATEANWYTHIGIDGQTSRGIVANYKRIGTGHYLHQLYEAEMRPGWYAPWPATRANKTPTSSGNYRYYELTMDTHYLEWDIPVGVLACDHMVIRYYRHATTGNTLVIQKSDGAGGWTDLATQETNGSAGFVQADVTLSASVAAGDTVRLKLQNGDAASTRPSDWCIYASAGTLDQSDYAVPVGAQTGIMLITTSIETAVQLRPAGAGAYEWCGGYYHNNAGLSSDDCLQTACVESVTVDGQAVTLGGYMKGNAVVLSRSSVVDYPTQAGLAAMTETYRFSATEWRYSRTLTTTLAMDVGVSYASMACVNASTLHTVGGVLELTADDVEFTDVEYTGSFYGGASLPNDLRVDVVSPGSNDGITDVNFVASTHKLYWKSPTHLNAQPGSTFTGGVAFSFGTGFSFPPFRKYGAGWRVGS